jgi:hypothetical protein
LPQQGILCTVMESIFQNLLLLIKAIVHNIFNFVLSFEINAFSND